MRSSPSTLRRAWQYLVRVAAGIGFLQILITATPVLRFWTGLLTTKWGPDTGDTLIVFGSDVTSPTVMGISSYWRTYAAISVWRDGHFRRVIVSGKDAAPLMKDFLVCHGIPGDSILVDNDSDSTRQNALGVSKLIAADAGNRRGGPIVLLTSDFHMRRALAALRKAGVDASPLPFPDAFKRMSDYSERWTIFCALSGETVKTLFYKSRGWT